jgi:hypothetical protein
MLVRVWTGKEYLLYICGKADVQVILLVRKIKISQES